MNSIRESKNDTHIILNSIIIAIMCTSNLLFYYIVYYFNYKNGFILIMGTAFALFFISSLIHSGIDKSNVASVSFLIGLVLFFYFISIFFNRIGKLSFISFCGYCLLPILFSLLEKSIKIVLETIMLISLFIVPVSSRFFEFEYVTLQQIDMSKAYAIFVTVSASIIHFCWYRKKSCMIIKLTYIVNIYLLLKLLSVGNRGIIASIIFLAFTLLFRYTQQSNISAEMKRKLSLFLFLIGITAVLLVLNGVRIIVFLYNYFNSLGGNVPSFIIKMYKLIVYKSDISNGRDEVYDFFINKFIERPFTGYGIKMSSTVSDGIYPYPHNYILQMLFEGGILFAIYPTIISIKMIFTSLFEKSENLKDEVLIIFLLCNCIPKMLLSGDIWNQTIFWLWIGVAASYFTQGRLPNGIEED